MKSRNNRVFEGLRGLWISLHWLGAMGYDPFIANRLGGHAAETETQKYKWLVPYEATQPKPKHKNING